MKTEIKNNFLTPSRQIYLTLPPSYCLDMNVFVTVELFPTRMDWRKDAQRASKNFPDYKPKQGWDKAFKSFITFT